MSKGAVCVSRQAVSISVRGWRYRVVTLLVEAAPVRLAVADTWRRRMRGLAGTLPADWAGLDGLLIPFPFAWRWSLWMRGMQFPIAVQWLRHGVPLGSRLSLTPDHPWRRTHPPRPADAVIEYLPV